jgi:ornithine cyclodeaminase
MVLLKQLGSKMLILSEKDVRRCLSMKDCLKINRKALLSVCHAAEQAGGTGKVPTRLGLEGPHIVGSATQDWTLFKPAAFYADMSSSSSSLMGVKVVSVRAQNPEAGLPLVPATVMVLDATTGTAKALVSATYLTGARTAASSGLATQLFRPDAQHLVVFGAGLQAECHIDAIQIAIGRILPKITIINRTRPRAEQLKEHLLRQNLEAAASSISSSINSTTSIDIVLLEDKLAVEKALSTADVIAATTNATQPLFENGSCLPPKCHINGIGSYTPEMQEIPVDAVNRCRILIDTEEAKNVGDLKHLLDEKFQEHPITLLGDALAAGHGDPIHKQIQNSKYDCTFYKGVGTAIQDIMTADLVVTRARELGIGTEVDMS